MVMDSLLLCAEERETCIQMTNFDFEWFMNKFLKLLVEMKRRYIFFITWKGFKKKLKQMSVSFQDWQVCEWELFQISLNSSI